MQLIGEEVNIMNITSLCLPRCNTANQAFNWHANMPDILIAQLPSSLLANAGPVAVHFSLSAVTDFTCRRRRRHNFGAPGEVGFTRNREANDGAWLHGDPGHGAAVTLPWRRQCGPGQPLHC